MSIKPNDHDTMPVVRSLEDFPRNSGNLLERLVFNHRLALLVFTALLTIALGFMATGVKLNASFVKMIPVDHPYIQNFLSNRDELRGMGNTLRIVVENPDGDIFDPRYLETLRQINDELFLT